MIEKLTEVNSNNRDNQEAAGGGNNLT